MTSLLWTITADGIVGGTKHGVAHSLRGQEWPAWILYQHIGRCHFNLWRSKSDSGTFNNLTDNKVKELEENKEKVYKITYDFKFWYTSWFYPFYEFHHSLFTTGNAQYSNNKGPMWSKRDTRISRTSHIIIVYKKSGCDRYRERWIERLMKYLMLGMYLTSITMPTTIWLMSYGEEQNKISQKNKTRIGSGMARQDLMI